MFTHISPRWSAFFRSRQRPAPPPEPVPPPPSLSAPRRSLATLEDRLLLVACLLPPDWRLPFAQELGRILGQRRRHGYLRLPPPKVPIPYDRFGTQGAAQRPLGAPAVCGHLRDEVEAIARLLEAPEAELCSTRRNCLLARRAARLGQLVDDLAEPRRGVDAWQELFLALLALPGAQGVGIPTRPRPPRRA